MLGPVNRLILGQNISGGDSAHIFSSDKTDPVLIQRAEGAWNPDRNAPVAGVVEQSKAMGVSLLRYPGGCLVHGFDWRKTVGPDAQKSGWLFGLDQYLTLCQAIGAVPLITMSDYALPAEQMPENLAEMVEYLNSPADASHPWAMKRKQWGHPAPYGVVWFELGNESIHGNHRLLPHRQFTAEEYAAYARSTAAAMRQVDPKIKLGILMVPGPGNDVDNDWNHTVIKLAGPIADFVIIHMYAPQTPNPGNSGPLLTQTMMVTPQHVEERLAEYHQMIRQQLGHDLPLAITEFNGAVSHDDAAYRLSYGNALECADLLRVFMEPKSNVALASFWQYLNGAFGMLRTNLRSEDGEPISDGPLVLLYELWAQHFGTQLVKDDVHSPHEDFAGAGTEEADHGSVSEPRKQLQSFDLDQYSANFGASWSKVAGVQIERQHADFVIHLHNLNSSSYPNLAKLSRPSAPQGAVVQFSLNFDARFTPDPGSETAKMGIGLVDSRGWNQTHSGIGIDTIGPAWTHLSGDYNLDAGTPSVNLIARLLGAGQNVSGTLEVRNLSVVSYQAARYAAYSLLTSSASISGNGKTLYLIVFNKSTTDSIAANIQLAGFSAAKARYWEVNGPSLESSDGVTETKQGANFDIQSGSAATHQFPAHSMTAIEFNAAQ